MTGIVAQLHPARLPESFTALGWPDLLAGFGIGLLAAALILTLIAPLLRRRPPRTRLPDRIAATRSLPPAERLLALAGLLTELGGHLPDDQRDALYAGAAGDPARVEALILSHRPGRA